MKVTLLCRSDILGEAAIATYRLMQALRRDGVDARMLVYSRLTDDPNVQLVGTRNTRGYRFLAERLRIFLANGYSTKRLFQVSLASTGYPLHKHPWVTESDAVIINWVNQGMMSLDGIEDLAALNIPVIWTMHDMWCLTGICHHAIDCNRYKGECGCCPLLASHKADDLSHKIWLQKRQLYNSMDIKFVAVSTWLAERCRESSLLGDRQVTVIPNAFPIDSFNTTPIHQVRSFNLDYSRNLIVMGASRLDDKVKGLQYAIDALNYLFDNNPKVARTAHAVLFGTISDRSLLDRLRFPFTYLGRVHDPKLLRQLYASAKVVLSTSLFETSGNTLIEGQAAGCYPVTFGRGGQSDIVDHLKTGYIAHYLDHVDVAKGIVWALEQPQQREMLHENVRQRFAASKVAAKYIQLIESAMKQEKDQ